MTNEILPIGEPKLRRPRSDLKNRIKQLEADKAELLEDLKTIEYIIKEFSDVRDWGSHGVTNRIKSLLAKHRKGE